MNDDIKVDSGAASSSMERSPFRLAYCAQLTGPARCVAVDSNDAFVAGTTSGVVSAFKRSAPASDWEMSPVLGGQRIHGTSPGLLYSMCKHRAGMFVSGGSDNRAVIWSSSSDDSRIGQLTGAQSKGINCVAQISNGDIITGSMDGSAVVWHKGIASLRLEGHDFGVEVLPLATGEIITASGNRETGYIRIWNNSVMIKSIDQAHNHIVRKLVSHPLGFASCGNDGFVKIWSNTGACLMSTEVHPATPDADSFIYGLMVLPNGDLVSVGEDCFARIINPNGDIIETVRHPGAVRDVMKFENGDFVTACSDGAVRIFTRNPARFANDDVQQAFLQSIELTENSKMTTLDQSQLRPSAVLDQPGDRPGQIVIVDVPGKGPTVYQWDQEAQIWIEIGQAVGKSSKTQFEGAEYDHVIDVVVHEGGLPVKLGFNKADDPASVARAFCSRHGLGEEALPQIIQYLTPLADPLARLAKQESQQKSLKLIPAWKAEGYVVDFKTVTPPLEAAIRLSTAGITEDESAILTALLGLLNTRSSYSNAESFTPAMSAFVDSLLFQDRWPIIPVLDLLKMLHGVHAGGVQIMERPEVVDRVIALCASSTANAIIVHSLTLKLFSNWIAKRRSDRSKPSIHVIKSINKLLSAIPSMSTDPNPTVNASFASFIHNTICLYGRCQIQDPEIYQSIINALFNFFSAGRKEKPTFFALLSLGTIGCISEVSRAMIAQRFGDALKSVISNQLQSSNPTVRQAAAEVQTVFSDFN